MTRKLVLIPFSPWSEKARFALDYCNVKYTRKSYTIMLDDWWVRILLKRPFGAFTLPFLIQPDGKVVEDSYALSRSIPEVAAQLFPVAQLDDILRVNQLCDQLLDTGRALASQAVLTDREAMFENIPPFIPVKLRPYLLSIVKIAISSLDKQFGVLAKSPEQLLQKMRSDLVQLREIIHAKKGREGTLLEQLSFADIAAAAALHFVSPVQHAKVRIAPHTRKTMTQPSLASEFQDLLTWRDALYTRYRDVSAPNVQA